MTEDCKKATQKKKKKIKITCESSTFWQDWQKSANHLKDSKQKHCSELN